MDSEGGKRSRDSELLDAVSRRNELILQAVWELLTLLDDGVSEDIPSQDSVGTSLSVTSTAGRKYGFIPPLREIEALSAAIYLRLGLSWDLMASTVGASRQALHRRLAQDAEDAMTKAIRTPRLHQRDSVELRVEEMGMAFNLADSTYMRSRTPVATEGAVDKAIWISRRSPRYMATAAISAAARFSELRNENQWWRAWYDR